MGALKIDRQQESGGPEDAEKLREIESLKVSIGNTLNDPEWRKFFSNKTIREYEEYLAAQNGEVLDDEKKTMGYVPQVDPPKYLKMTYDAMQREGRVRQERFKPIQQVLDVAVRDKIASQADMDFLIAWIQNGDFNFDTVNAPKFAKIVKEKIARMQRDKKQYEQLSKSEFALELKLGGKIKLNDERTFLEATVPERRAFLKEAQAQITTMEVEEAIEKEDVKELKALYLKRLTERLCNKKGKGGCIGQMTFEAYTEELDKQDLEGLKYWHKEFEAQMKPREQFWTDVRGTLRENGLRDMESMMNNLGLKEAKKEFEIIKADESSRLCMSYSKALDQYKGKLFGDHTDQAFRTWMQAQPLSVQYEAEGQLTEQMWPYKRLWKEVDLYCSEAQQESMRAMLKDPKVGLTELKEQVEKYKNGDQEKDREEAEQIRNQLDGSGRRALDSTFKVFNKLSQADQEAFIQMITRANQGQTRGQFDAVAKQEEAAPENVRQLHPLEEKNTVAETFTGAQEEAGFVEEKGLEDSRANDDTYTLEGSEGMPPGEPSQNVEVTKIHSFEEVRDRQKNKRRAKIMANDKESLEASIRAHRQTNFKEEDQMVITTDTGSGEQAADSRTVLSIEAYLKAKRKANQSK